MASLVQVMMDPYFRTITGFQSLVQKEWVMAGYPFLDRCNHLKRSEKEVSTPVASLALFKSIFTYLCMCVCVGGVISVIKYGVARGYLSGPSQDMPLRNYSMRQIWHEGGLLGKGPGKG